MLRRKRTTLLAEAAQLAEQGHAAFRMAGVVRRKSERPSKSGEKFAFVTLSDPTGEFEVLFPPETLRKCRDLLEPGRALLVKVRCKGREGELRFFGDDAETLDTVATESSAGLRVYMTPNGRRLKR